VLDVDSITDSEVAQFGSFWCRCVTLAKVAALLHPPDITASLISSVLSCADVAARRHRAASVPHRFLARHLQRRTGAARLPVAAAAAGRRMGAVYEQRLLRFQSIPETIPRALPDRAPHSIAPREFPARFRDLRIHRTV
jgi:hypothetical protein